MAGDKVWRIAAFSLLTPRQRSFSETLLFMQALAGLLAMAAFDGAPAESCRICRHILVRPALLLLHFILNNSIVSVENEKRGIGMLVLRNLDLEVIAMILVAEAEKYAARREVRYVRGR